MKKEKKIELVGGRLVDLVAESIRKGCERPEIDKVCSGGNWRVWCLRDGSGKMEGVRYYLQGELPKGDELASLDEVVWNYDKRKLWKTRTYHGI